MNEQNKNLDQTSSDVFIIPESREFSASQDVDRSIKEEKLGVQVTGILIEQVPSVDASIVVNHPKEVLIQSADVPFNQTSKVAGTIDKHVQESNRRVPLEEFKGGDVSSVIGHDENIKKMDAQITALTGIPVNNHINHQD